MRVETIYIVKKEGETGYSKLMHTELNGYFLESILADNGGWINVIEKLPNSEAVDILDENSIEVVSKNKLELLADILHSIHVEYLKLILKATVIKKGSVVIPMEIIDSIEERIETSYNDLDFDAKNDYLSNVVQIFHLIN